MNISKFKWMIRVGFCLIAIILAAGSTQAGQVDPQQSAPFTEGSNVISGDAIQSKSLLPSFQVHSVSTWPLHGVLIVLSLFGCVLYFALRKKWQLDKAFCESAAQNKTLLNSAVQAIIGVDTEGKCSFCNASALKLLAYEFESELIGQKVHQFLYPPKIDSDMVFPNDCGVCQACHKGTTLHLEETTLIRSDNEEFPAELWANPIVVDSDVKGGIITFIDISERLEVQKQNIRMAQLASIGELSASIAHEINNPMSGVINYSQILLNQQDLTEKQRDLITRVQNEGIRVAGIVHNLLNYARDSNGNKNFHNVADIVTEALALLNTKFKHENVELKFDWADAFPKIKCNAQQIEQVLINIFRNAYQALAENSSDHRIIKTSGSIVLLDGRDHLQLVIANNGPHIPVSILEKIKKPFFTTKPPEVGTGLGLSVTATILKEHKGQFEIRSRPGAFTEMILTFPVD